MSVSKLHTNTRCQVINLADMRFEFHPGRAMTTFKVFLRDGNMIQSNIREYSDEIKSDSGVRYFLIDWKDLASINKVLYPNMTQEQKDQKTREYLSSLEKFSEYFSKRIYVRLIPPSTVLSWEEPRVFADEVVEVIPVALKQQKTPIEKDDARLTSFRIRFAALPGTYRVLTVSELETILDQFDIDKSLITLIPDPSYEISRRDSISESTTVKLFGPDSTLVSDIYKVMNDVYSLSESWENGKSHIMSCFETLQSLNGFFLDHPTSEKLIEKVRNEFDRDKSSSNARKQQRGKEANNKRDPFSKEELHELAGRLLDHWMYVIARHIHPRYISGSKEKHVPDWEYRIFTRLESIQKFFEKEDNQIIKNILIECLYFMVPDQHVAATKEFVSSVLNGSIRLNKGEVVELSTQKSLDDNVGCPAGKRSHFSEREEGPSITYSGEESSSFYRFP